MKQLFICRGIPGSGKSHIANLITKGLGDALILSADDLRLYDGEYKFIPEHEEFIWERFEELFFEALEDETKNIIIDNTNLRTINYDVYKRSALERGYLVHEIIVGDFDVDKSAKRGTHSVPVETLKAMKEMFQFPI